MYPKGVGSKLEHPGKQYVSVGGRCRAEGILRVPGDKSISHRALFGALLSGGEGRLDNCNLAQDCLATMAAMTELGLTCRREGGSLIVCGREGDWTQGKYSVDAGNSGTTARLLLGLAGFLQPGGSITISGDESLSRRPMERVARYLRPMGLSIVYLEEPGRLPICVKGAGALQAVSQEIEVPSAQVKSAVLLAGLAAPGVTEVVQKSVTRDHTEVMLAAMGADIRRSGHSIRLVGRSKLNFPQLWKIPGDFSSAAWWLALAAVSGQVTLTGVGVNPTRIGFARILEAMGAGLSFSNYTVSNGEAVADIDVSQGELQGVEVPPELIPTCIDELPALAVVAAFARGRTVVRGAGELKFKESNRLEEIAGILSCFGASYDLLPDGFIVRGGARLRPAQISSGDHRIVMAATIMAALTPGVSQLGDTRWLDTSYPEFIQDLDRISGCLSQGNLI